MFTLLEGCLKKKTNEITSINWCSSERQLADCLTKATSSPSKLITVFKRDSGSPKST